MKTPLRILRAYAEDLRRTPIHLTERERLQVDDILDRGQSMLARFPRQTLSFADFAGALKLSPGTVRRHFADLDALLGDILQRHLRAIATAVGEVPRDAPNRLYHLCAAYLGATRLAFGRMTAAHLILTRTAPCYPMTCARHSKTCGPAWVKSSPAPRAPRF